MVVKITYYVHGTTKDNENNIATGWNHGKLSTLGINQSKELSKIVSLKKFDIVFCSDLNRAIESAKIVFGDKNKIIQDKRLRECNYGKLNGQEHSIFKDRLEEYINNKFPKGESYRDVEKRIKNFILFLKKKHDNKKIAIVSHQAPQLALEVLLNNKTWKEAIDTDWRKEKAWQPGWNYEIK